jgi:hypothetical protein
MYLHLTWSISYGVNLYVDLQNVNKFYSIKFDSATVITPYKLISWKYIPNYNVHVSFLWASSEICDWFKIFSWSGWLSWATLG